MTEPDAQRWAGALARTFPANPVVVVTYARPARYGWAVVVVEEGSTERMTLPDAASCAAYRDARAGSVPQAGAPDFGREVR